MGDLEKDSVHKSRSRFEIYCEKLNVNPNLFMLKVTLFMMYGATGSLLPFLTIHMQSIGLTVEEIAIVYLALPLTTFLSPPVTGFLVDKFGHFKPVVLFSLVFNLIFHHSLMLIPQMEIPGEVPAAYIMRHPTTGKVEVWWSPCRSRECPDEEQLSLVLHECMDHCLLQPDHTTTATASSNTKAIRPIKPCSNNLPHCKSSLPSRGQSQDELMFEVVRGNKKKNSTQNRQKTMVHNSSELWDKVFFVPQQLLTENTTEQTFMEENINVYKVENDTSMQAIKVRVTMHPDLGEAIENLGLTKLPDEDEEITNFTQHFSKELLVKAGVDFASLENEDLRCGGVVLNSNQTSTSTYNTLKELAADCMVQKCTFRDGGPEICPPDYKESAPHVFWLYFFLRFVGTTMLAASVTVMDPIALTMIQKYGGEFGRERLFSTLGMAVFAPLTGVLIDFKSRKLGYTDYSAAFYTYDTLLIVSTISLLLMPIGAKVPADNIMRDMIRLLKLPHVIMFIFFLFLLGNCWGFIESYLFLYLKELGAPNYLLGITVTVGTLSSVPFLYGAERITKKIGHVNIIVIAFFAHAARLMGYSFIESAWWCFPFEAIEALSVHLMWVAAATYCAVIAPKTLLATLIGVLGMAHFSLGRGSGSFVGGLLIGTYGTREAFQIMGLLGMISGLVYGFMYFFWLHKFDDGFTNESLELSTDSGEVEKLNRYEDNDSTIKDTTLSAERLSLMIRFNHRGSLTSLDRGSRLDLFRSNSSRRNSGCVELYHTQSKTSSSFKVDHQKLPLDVSSTHKSSNSHLNSNVSPTPHLQRYTTKVTFSLSEGAYKAKQTAQMVSTESVAITSPQSNRKNPKSMPIDEYRSRSGSILEEEEAVNGSNNKKEMIKNNTSEGDHKSPGETYEGSK